MTAYRITSPPVAPKGRRGRVCVRAYVRELLLGSLLEGEGNLIG